MKILLCNSQITSFNDERGAVTLFRTNKGQRLKSNTLFSPSNTINTIQKKIISMNKHFRECDFNCKRDWGCLGT